MRRDVVQVHHHPERRHRPDAVLVFCWLENGIVWVRHPDRGWEVPGGKVEPGETPEQAAHREVYEECGATLDTLQWIGEYALDCPSASQGTTKASYKWVYSGHVSDISARPSHSEIASVRVVRPPWTPDVVRFRSDISYIMKDRAFSELWPLVLRAETNGEMTAR